MILLQAAAAATPPTMQTDIFSLMVKGGWIMIPLLILAVLAVYLMTDGWFLMKRMLSVDPKWFSKVNALTAEGNINEAAAISGRNDSAVGRITRAALRNAGMPKDLVEEEIQLESRQVVARLETPVSYLSMIAAIAPMMGFLGTIFGVIRIFINVAATNDLSISSISDGLYQKMICSGVGLLVGVCAYIGYYVLNRRVDKVVMLMDKGGNMLIRSMYYKATGK